MTSGGDAGDGVTLRVISTQCDECDLEYDLECHPGCDLECHLRFGDGVIWGDEVW